MTASPDTLRAAGAVPGADFAAFDLAARRSVVAAVSGGSDSTALLLLAKSHLAISAPTTRLVAVTVDHALRAESAAEAESVAKLCESIEVGHRTLRWEGGKPAAGVAAAAREARYRLLAQAARETGSDIVMTGHTADDQAETVAMRSARGKGRGLAGMASATLYENEIWIVRPLLETARADLRDYLVEGGTGWFDDPSNSNTAYERARLRAAGVDGAAAAIRRAGAERTALSRAAAGLIDRHAALAGPGLVRLGGEFARSPEGAALHALRVLLAVMGGAEHLPDATRARKLLGRLGGGPFRATLSRSVVDSRRAGIFLYRELRGLPPAVTARDRALWDGRFRLGIVNGAPPTIAPVGRERAKESDPSAFEAPASVLRAAIAAQPRLESSDAASAVAVAMPVLAPWARLLPAFDLDTARAVATLIGAAEIPEPPFVGHKGRIA